MQKEAEPEQVAHPAVTELHNMHVSVCKKVFGGHWLTQVFPAA